MDDGANDAETPPPFVPEEGIEPYGGRPILATALCALLLVGSCVGSTGMPAGAMPGSRAEAIGQLAGGALVGALLWGIAYLITIKRASPRAKRVSLAILTALGLLTTLVALGRSRSAMQTDIRAATGEVNQTVANLDQGRTMRAGNDAGPLTRLTARATNDTLALARQFNAEADAAGLQQVTSFVGLTRGSPVLDRCDRVTALTERAGATGRAIVGVADRLRRDGETMVARGELSRGQLDAFLAGATRGRQGLEQQWALIGDLARDGGVLCSILARRRWQLGPDGTVLFTDNGDLARAQPVLARISVTGAAIEARKAQARDNVQRATAAAERF